MFDQGYLAVAPDHRLLVSPRLRAEFGNGEAFYPKAGIVIALPERGADRPGRESVTSVTSVTTGTPQVRSHDTCLRPYSHGS
jgi:hypothetical protein